MGVLFLSVLHRFKNCDISHYLQQIREELLLLKNIYIEGCL